MVDIPLVPSSVHSLFLTGSKVGCACSILLLFLHGIYTFNIPPYLPPPPHPPPTTTPLHFIAGSEFAVWLKGFKLGARCGQKFKHRVSNLEQDMPRLKKHGQLEQDAESMRTSKVTTTRDTWRCPGQDSALTWKTRAICRNEVASGAA